MKISSIDVGSNAIRQIIVDVDTEKYKKNPSSAYWKTIRKYRAPIRLGTDVFKDRKISDETLKLLIDSFTEMAQLNHKYQVQKVVCTATSAFRDSLNGSSIIKKIYEKTKIKIVIISGKKEAELIRQAVTQCHIINFEKTLMIDIGGGSLELTSVENNRIAHAVSFPLGVVRLKSLLQTKANLDVTAHATQYFKLFKKKATSSFEVAIGTGGNFDALSKLKIEFLKKTPQTNLSLKEIYAIQKKWNQLSERQKRLLPIRSDRIDVLPLALKLIITCMEQFHITKLKIPGTGLKEGLIYSVLNQHDSLHLK